MKRFLLLSILGTYLLSTPVFSMEQENEYCVGTTPLSTIPVTPEAAAASDSVKRKALLAKYESDMDMDLVSPELRKAAAEQRCPSTYFSPNETVILPGALILGILERDQMTFKRAGNYNPTLKVGLCTSYSALPHDQYYVLQYTNYNELDHYWNMKNNNARIEFCYHRQPK